MKSNILKTWLLIALTILLSSNAFAGDKKVNLEESKVNWKGYKVTGSHEGDIKLSEGALTFEGETLTGGSFTIDMTTINVTDLKAGQGKEKLEAHLNSNDFFGVEDHKKAMFKITKVTGENGNYRVYGDLTIKGKTLPKTFELTVSGNTATASFKIDRTKFGIEYGSSNFFENLKDKAIYDEFDLNVTLKF